MTPIKIKNDNWETSVRLANQFIAAFPNRVGYRNGVAYTDRCGQCYYIYRTKSGMIVVS